MRRVLCNPMACSVSVFASWSSDGRRLEVLELLRLWRRILRPTEFLREGKRNRVKWFSKEKGSRERRGHGVDQTVLYLELPWATMARSRRYLNRLRARVSRVF